LLVTREERVLESEELHPPIVPARARRWSEITASGSRITLKTVRTCRTSFCWCEMTDSFVSSSPRIGKQ
jgi:hypothetical protein